MSIFSILPANLFSILASKNKDIYVDALFVLRKAFKQEVEINKSDLASMIISDLDQKLFDLDIEEEDALESKEYSDKNPSSMAYFIIRRLKDTGWLNLEYKEESFEEMVSLPPYSIKIIDLLYSFIDVQSKEYNSYVYSTYSSLKNAHQEKEGYFYAFITAYENTIKLNDELKTLLHNIGRFHQELSNYFTANDILKSHFDDYKNLVFDRVYHPIKTFDSIPKYKMPILNILKNWLENEFIINEIVQQAIMKKIFSNVDDAYSDVISKINQIIEIFEGVNNLLDKIDYKNSVYTRASVEKLRYMLNIDRSIKSKIVKILTKTSEMPQDKEDRIIEDMSSAINLYNHGYIDEDSLYIRAVKNTKNDQKPLEMVDISADNQALLLDFLEKFQNQYSHKKVMEFVESLLKEADVIDSNQIIIENDHQFILLILAVIKGNDKNVFYRVEISDGYTISNGYRLPCFKFIRKGKKDVSKFVREIDAV